MNRPPFDHREHYRGSIGHHRSVRVGLDCPAVQRQPGNLAQKPLATFSPIPESFEDLFTVINNYSKYFKVASTDIKDFSRTFSLVETSWATCLHRTQDGEGSLGNLPSPNAGWQGQFGQLAFTECRMAKAVWAARLHRTQDGEGSLGRLPSPNAGWRRQFGQLSFKACRRVKSGWATCLGNLGSLPSPNAER